MTLSINMNLGLTGIAMSLKRNEEGQWTYYQQLLKHRRKDSARQRLWTSLVFYIVPETITIQLYKSTVNLKKKKIYAFVGVYRTWQKRKGESMFCGKKGMRSEEARRKLMLPFLSSVTAWEREREVWASRTPESRPDPSFILVQSNY